MSLSHGDRLGAPWHYHIYLAITRSFWFRFAGLMVPQACLDKLCLSISRRSRARSSEVKVPHKKILQNIERWLDLLNTDHGIVGHFHIPYQANHPKKGKMMGLCSWDQPNALGFDGQKFRRYYLKGPGREFIIRLVRPALNG